MSTYVPIQAITLSSTATEVVFTGIPQTYTDLVLVVRASFSAEEYLCYQFNGDTASNYSETPIVGNGSSVSSGRAANRAFIFTQAVAGAGVPFIAKSNFQNYANSTTNKTVLSRTDCASRDVTASAGLWRNTAAITSIRAYALTGNNFQSGSTFTLYGVGSGSPKAFGGDEVRTDGTFWYHIFNSSGRFEPVQALSNVDYLVIAGGGAGGGREGAGGGAGGYRTSIGGTPLSLTAQTYTVTVGAGGVGASAVTGGSGSNSTFATITSTGGGGGGAWTSNGVSGGSGGGGGGVGTQGSASTTGGNGNTGNYTPVEGYKGGDRLTTNDNAGPGGGGGSSAVGQNGNIAGPQYTAGAGGAGTTSTISGSSVTRAGGGGGGGYGNPPRWAAGGSGGGGDGGKTADANGSAGTVNTGSGGGGGASFFTAQSSGGNGGSGIVIIRYAV